MNNTERRLLGEVFELCCEISTKSDADVFFDYAPHVNAFAVKAFEFGWTQYSKGEHYACYETVNRDNLLDVLEQLYALRARKCGVL